MRGVLAVVLLSVGRLPPSSPLPNPNGHDDFTIRRIERDLTEASVSGYQARTSITELSVPCWFQTFSRASRSGIHSPSRTNLYS